ncbi:MAG TPA: response regulator [Candidatus Omnitrophota bacterium]|nr:response regulator [Candidatus Omnitrophota bacterium]
MENKEIKVLLVDDEIDFVEPVAMWLEARGYNVNICRNGKEAVDSVRLDPPNIIFMDINMPVLDGLDALEAIRAFAPNMPIVMVTGIYRDEEKINRAKKLGIAGFFSKNYTFDHLLEMIQVTLHTHKNLSLDERAL